jgi:hypothetical protein
MVVQEVAVFIIEMMVVKMFWLSKSSITKIPTKQIKEKEKEKDRENEVAI